MDKLPSPILTDVLEVISTANESLDYDLLRQKVIDAFFRTISAEGVVFFLPETNGQLTGIKVKNLDHLYCDYYRKYFYQFDPLGLSKGLNSSLASFDKEKIFSYDSFLSTEYYNDFLRPQRIHHKLIVNLVAEKELYGRLVLTRPRSLNGFTRSEMLTVKTISPYLAHALAHNNLRRKIRLKGTVLKYIEKQSSIGIILLNEKLQVVYHNDKAVETIANITSSDSSLEQRDKLPSRILNGCRELFAELRKLPQGGASVSRQSTIKGDDQVNYAITSRALEQGPDWEDSLLIMVSIEKQLSPKEQSLEKINPQTLMAEFDLSKREIDVVELLFLGLKNAQIAQQLFVSEVTVKKHLQNIYEKVGVKNRTMLVNRILTA